MAGLITAHRELLGRDLPIPIARRNDLEQHGPALAGTFGLHPPVLDMGALYGCRLVPAGFLQVGFWGHGINSHAFYFCEVTDRRRVFLRLPFGGVYMNPDTQRSLVNSVIDAYAAFDGLSGSSDVDRLVAIDWMGEGRIAALFNDGREACVELDSTPGSGFARVLAATRSYRPDRRRP